MTSRLPCVCIASLSKSLKPPVLTSTPWCQENADCQGSSFKSGRDELGKTLDCFPLLNRKRAFVIRHQIGGID